MNLKSKLSKKLRANKGFTLIEMLIVVAIIAILVIVSIPMVSSSLDKAKSATDDANVRAAKAAAMIQYMLEEDGTGKKTYYYNAATGKAQDDEDTITGYGQSSDHKDEYVIVTIEADGTVEANWSSDGT